jgi:hypothetical protein
METDKKLQYNTRAIHKIWNVLEDWSIIFEKYVEFIDDECGNRNEQTAQAACMAFAIMGNLGELVRLHKALTDYETNDLERMTESGEGGFTDGKECKHEEFIRLVADGMKRNYNSRMNIMSDLVKMLKNPNYELAFNTWKNERMGEEDFELMKTTFTNFAKDYIEDTKE